MIGRPRARDLGVPFDGEPGAWNAITDVPGVEVGYSTLMHGDGPLRVGHGPVRTGVTAILPRGRSSSYPVYAGWAPLNGAGEMTGTAWIDESGILDGPVLITTTHSVGTVRDASIQWRLQHGTMTTPFALPVVAETWDGALNDANGFHVKPPHVYHALESARGGSIDEGSVGGGTGMICHGFKGGTGTASRRLPECGFTVGALVQANYGARSQLRIAGVPVGAEMPEGSEAEAHGQGPEAHGAEAPGSIIVVLATDAPALPHQLRGAARRGMLGVARCGGCAGVLSGDLFLAFSTANLDGQDHWATHNVAVLGLTDLNRLFEAAVQATEEAIVNALAAAETMTGIDGFTAHRLPHDRLQEILKKYGRLRLCL